MAANLVSLDLLKKWGEKERIEFLEICQRVIQNLPHSSPLFGTKCDDIGIIFHDVCWHAINGSISVDAAVSALAAVVHLHNDLPSVIADVLGSMDTESHVIDSHNVRERFYGILRGCSGKIVPEYIIRERLEFETLGEAGILKLLRNTQTRFIKTKTRLFYKQQKFNLFREESEGYAKLITELNPETGDKIKAVYVLEVIKSLIGCFNLDPNRVLDIILESFESRPELFEFFISLLRSFSCTSVTLSQVIGFKFGFYQQDDSEETPATLYRVAALLLKGKLISLNQLYGLLKPDDSIIDEKHKQELTDALAYTKQINVATAGLEKTEVTKEQNKNEVPQLKEDNQKVGLCAALLDVGDWEHAELLMAYFPDYYAISHHHIAKKLCTLIHVLIDKFYKQHNFSLQIKQGTDWHLNAGVEVQEVENFAQLFSLVFPMVLSLGPYLHIDPILMAKIIRLSKYWLSQRFSTSDSGMKSIISIVDESLLPSLSLLDCNCCMAEELWSLLKLFPYQHRYNFYCRWKNTSHVTHPLLIKTKADALKRLKYIMKRLSKENVKPSGRQIGKLSHSNPGYLFDYVLSQIQTWDNLIVPVVDSLKYLTSLSYDVLAYCIIEALANSEKDRMKHDGTTISLWLQSLASFGGTVFKKYPIEIAGLLQYVANQLKAEKSLDLLVLKEIVLKMAGIEAPEEMTSDQLEAMTGGEILRTEGGYYTQTRNVKKSSQRLKEALLEQDLAIPLCLLMAQQRQCILYREQEQSHLKLVGKLYDQCQDTLVQYGSFLASNLNTEDYISRVPSVTALLSEYSIQADVAFFLVRPSFNFMINSKFEELKKQDKVSKTSNNSQHLQKYLDAVESVIGPIVQSVKLAQSPKRTLDDLSLQFYFTFWSLTVYDLSVPTSSYEREIVKLKAVLQNDENKDISKKKKEKERCDALIAKLQEEEKMQHEHCARVMARLKGEKDSWFQSKAAKNETITQFLQSCVFPRSVFTPVDAVFCAKFVHLIHCLKTPNFSTLLCYDRIFCDITYTVAACTENEANRYGLFLCSMLETVMRWHSNKSIFDKECANFPGFMTKFKVTTQTSDSATDHVDYENYRHVCHKWHFKITKALLKCLESGDYVQIRNALLVLIKVSQFFPVITNLSQALERRLDKIRLEEKEKRPDIYAMATCYSGIIKTKKPSLVLESEFHIKETARANTTVVTVKTESLPRIEKELERYIGVHIKPDSIKEKVSKLEAKIDASKSSINSKISAVEKLSTAATNSQSSSKSRVPHKEIEHNGVDSTRLKPRIKEEKGSGDSSSPMRREERNTVKNDTGEKLNVKDDKRDRRDEYYDKSQRINANEKDAVDGTRDLYVHRRTGDIVDGDREHKRRRTDGPSKSPRDAERDLRSTEKSKDDEKTVSRDKQSMEKVYKETDASADKIKGKDKKTTRKRDYSDDNAMEPRRRRVKTEDDESSKRSGENEVREREQKQRREDKSPVVYVSNPDRRTDRDDKKHHRSSSATSAKKRS